MMVEAWRCQYDPIWLGTALLISTSWPLEPPRLETLGRSLRILDQV